MSPGEAEILSGAESVCPDCFTILYAELVAKGDVVFMRKACPEHGPFETVVWRGASSYQGWARPKIPFRSNSPQTKTKKGCPLDCGLCPEHRQQACTALVEITSRCNLNCTFCFANSGMDPTGDPTIDELRDRLKSLRHLGYTPNIQISGGEPTLRDDLPEIITLTRSLGFDFVQLNTNGLRIADDPGYAFTLKDAGLSSVFLQFDGMQDSIYVALRRRALLTDKVQAVRNLARAGLGVVLVPTLVSGVNMEGIGDIISFAVKNLPVVRGVHFQPVTYAGRRPYEPSDQDRVTLPEVMRAIAIQSGGRIDLSHFAPPGCENARCSFHADYVVMADGRLIHTGSCSDATCSCVSEKAEAGADRTRRVVRERWTMPEVNPGPQTGGHIPMGAWDELLERAQTHQLTISGMAFQDAWNLDLERLKDCCIHVLHDDGHLIPFCAYNITDRQGRALHRGRRQR